MSFRFREVNSFFELKKEIIRFISYNNKNEENTFIGMNSLYPDIISFGCDRTFHLKISKSCEVINITFTDEENPFSIETDLKHAFLFVKGLLETSRF